MRSTSRVTRKRKKHLKKLSVSKNNKSSDNKSDISSECDSDLQLDNRLNYIIRNQTKFKMGSTWKSKYDIDDFDNDNDSDDGDDDGDEDFNDDAFVDGEQKAKEIFLPSSFHGSPRHRKKLALNALSIVTEKGKPTMFITGTCNVNWPEIQSQLTKGQTAFDRPDVVMQVFRMRLAKFMHNLRNGKI